MSIILATDDFQDSWDAFVKANAPDGGLLQSWRWGDFQKALGYRIFRLALFDSNNQLRAVALVIRHELAFEYTYLYVPRGPVVTPVTTSDDLALIIDEIKTIAREEKSFMVKVDPPWAVGSHNNLEAVGFRKSEHETQPKCSFIINIADTEEQILAQMKPKTRYNIGLAQRRGVTIRVSHDFADLEPFWQLMKQTAKRDQFQSHLKEHYKKMLEVFGFDQTVELFLAEYDRKVVAAAMVSFFGTMGTYLHGASADSYRDVMAPYLLQWQAIGQAKRLGCQYYDFGGVNGVTYTNDKWEGITRFKTGFGDAVSPHEYIGGYEFILNPVVFAAYKFVKQIRG